MQNATRSVSSSESDWDCQLYLLGGGGGFDAITLVRAEAETWR